MKTFENDRNDFGINENWNPTKPGDKRQGFISVREVKATGRMERDQKVYTLDGGEAGAFDIWDSVGLAKLIERAKLKCDGTEEVIISYIGVHADKCKMFRLADTEKRRKAPPF